MNIECLDKRKIERFATRCPIVEIRDLSRSGQLYRGELIDCTNAGVGLFVPYPVRPPAIIVLRACHDISCHGAQEWPADAGGFHLVSAEVRWCQAWVSAEGRSGYRIGVARLSPAI
jgi:hypothetical protein